MLNKMLQVVLASVIFGLGSLRAEHTFYTDPTVWGNALDQFEFYSVEFPEQQMAASLEHNAPITSSGEIGQSLTFPGASIGWPSDVRFANDSGGSSQLYYKVIPNFLNFIGTSQVWDHDYSVHFDNGAFYAAGIHVHAESYAGATTAVHFFGASGLIASYTTFGLEDRFIGIISDEPVVRVQYDDDPASGGRGIIKVDAASAVIPDVGFVFSQDKSEWEHGLVDAVVNHFEFTPANMMLADELDAEPVDNQDLGDELNFRSENIGWTADMSVHLVEGDYLIYRDRGTNDVMIGAASVGWHHDWSINFGVGAPVYHAAITFRDGPSAVTEHIRVFDTLGGIIGTYNQFDTDDNCVTVSSTRPIGSIAILDSPLAGGRGVQAVSIAIAQAPKVRFFDHQGRWANSLMRSSLYCTDYSPENAVKAREITELPTADLNLGDVVHFDAVDTGWPVDYSIHKDVGDSVTYFTYENTLENLFAVPSAGWVHEWSVHIDNGAPVFAAGLGFRVGGPSDTTAIRVYNKGGDEIGTYTDFGQLAPFVGIISEEAIGRIAYDDAPGAGGRGLRSFCLAVQSNPTIERISFDRGELCMTITGLSPNAAVQIEALRVKHGDDEEGDEEWDAVHQFVPTANVNTTCFKYKGQSKHYRFRARLVQ